MEGDTPISNAEARFFSAETGTLITAIISDEKGLITLSLPYGPYRVVVTHPKYVSLELFLMVDRDVIEVVSLTPSIPTLLWRFMPVIGAVIAAIALVFIARKISAALAKRLAREEEMF